MSKTQLKAKNFLKLLITSVLLGISFLILYKIYNKFIYSFGFTDEGDNISIGQYLLMGQKLYRDVFSQHQPVTYYISAFIQKLTQPDNLLLVVRRHRQFVMFLSFASVTFLTIYFGLFLLPFLFILEILKYYFLGHLFLAEGLVIYPLIFLFLLWWESLHGKKLKLFEALLASVAAFFAVFNLLPTAFGIFIIFLTFIVKNLKKKKIISALFLPAIFMTLALFLIVPLDGFIEGTLWANFFYYIPKSSKLAFNIEQPLYSTLFNAAFYPLTTFFVPNNALITTYRLLALSFFASVGFYLKSTKKYWMIALLLFLLFVSNLRPSFSTHIFYHSFHSLPHFALFVSSCAVLMRAVFASKLQKKFKIASVAPIFFIFLTLIFSKSVYYNENINERDISYINFAEMFTYSTSIKTLADPNDTLAVIPHEELLYWYPRLLPATRFLFYEAWVHDVPKFRKEIYENLEQNPPTFVYWPETELEPFLHTDDYVSIPRNTATYSALHVYKSKLPNITDDQWKALEVHGFQKVQLKQI